MLRIHIPARGKPRESCDDANSFTLSFSRCVPRLEVKQGGMAHECKADKIAVLMLRERTNEYWYGTAKRMSRVVRNYEVHLKS